MRVEFALLSLLCLHYDSVNERRAGQRIHQYGAPYQSNGNECFTFLFKKIVLQHTGIFNSMSGFSYSRHKVSH